MYLSMYLSMYVSIYLHVCTCIFILSTDETYHSDSYEDTEDDSMDIDCSLADSGYSGSGSSPLSHESRFVHVNIFQVCYKYMYIGLNIYIVD